MTIHYVSENKSKYREINLIIETRLTRAMRVNRNFAKKRRDVFFCVCMYFQKKKKKKFLVITYYINTYHTKQY